MASIDWIENKLPKKIYWYNLGRNPKTSFYFFLSLCIVATIILGIMLTMALLSPTVTLGEKIFGFIMTIWVLFLGYWGAIVGYVSDCHNAHKIKWENGKVYLWNKYLKNTLVYSFEEIDGIIFGKNGFPKGNASEGATEMALMIKERLPIIPIRTSLAVALNMEIGLKSKEDWERWKRAQNLKILGGDR